MERKFTEVWLCRDGSESLSVFPITACERNPTEISSSGFWATLSCGLIDCWTEAEFISLYGKRNLPRRRPKQLVDMEL